VKVGAVWLRAPPDRAAFDSRLRFDQPLDVRIRRDGAELDAVLNVQRADASIWRTQSGVVLGIMRTAQLAMLLLAVIIVWKRPHDAAACVGAWLLASLSVFCVVLPSRFSAVWHDLPGPLGAVLWLPYVSSMAAGAILATFYSVFPQRVPGWRAIVTLTWFALAPFLALNVYDRFQVVHHVSDGPLRHTGLSWLLTPANLFFVAVGVLVMASNYHRLESRTERRRVRLVLGASWVGCTSAACVVTLYVLAPSADLRTGMFSSWSLTAGMLPVFLVPFSFAYAILRHRLFDISIMLRRGLQYALARRLLLLLVPALTIVVLGDMLRHRDASMGELVAGHVWWCLALLAAVAWIFRNRRRWLEALDRRYFREHYSAQLLLRELAEDLQRTRQFDQLAPVVVGRIEAALHPVYVALLVRSEDGRSYECVASTSPEQRQVSFSRDDRAVRLLAVLGQPLVVGRDAPRSVFEELPAAERAALEQNGTDLLVGVTGPDERP
jgi:hypothetical protein